MKRWREEREIYTETEMKKGKWKEKEEFAQYLSSSTEHPYIQLPFPPDEITAVAFYYLKTKEQNPNKWFLVQKSSCLSHSWSREVRKGKRSNQGTETASSVISYFVSLLLLVLALCHAFS